MLPLCLLASLLGDLKPYGYKILTSSLIVVLIACESNEGIHNDIALIKGHLSDMENQIDQLQKDITRLETLIGAEKQSPLPRGIDGSKQKHTTTDGGTQGQIVFVHEGIYIMDANGQNAKRIYDRLASIPYHHDRSIVRPKWSHDGKKIVFMSPSLRNGFGYNDICIINTDGSNPTAYANRVSAPVLNPVWSRQGEIVYERSNSGHSDGLWLGFTRIREDTFQADYQADGTMVYVKDRKRKGSIPNIYTFHPLTERESRLTFQRDSYPAWSPDGSKIVFVRWIAWNDPFPQNDIFVMNADGSFSHNITQHPADDTDPTWSPDGTHIAFMSNRQTLKPHIWTMQADGSDLRKLHPGRAPDWK